ncbi:MAG: hypothetical protein J6U54_18590 [Clostridiales bacterium]|nr:hypothetical protein [Clostridiales bacterium]
MIETYTFTHKGGLEEYDDEVFVGFGSFTVAVVVNGNGDKDMCRRVSLAVNRILKNDFENMSFDDITYLISKLVKYGDEYTVIRITDDEIETEQHGAIKVFIVHDGDIKQITNGLSKINNEDRIICGTDRFFKYLSSDAILADALSSISAEEWMDFLISRISDRTMLKGDNLSAVTFIVRNTENIKLA